MITRKHLSLLGLIALSAILLAACGPAAQPTPTPVPDDDGGMVATEPPTEGAGGGLAGTSWTLTQIDATAVDSGIGATLVFDADRVTGSGGCNGFGGGYTASGTSITFTEIASTLMACDDAKMAVEGSYLTALQGTASFTQTTDTLVITSATGVKLTFAASK